VGLQVGTLIGVDGADGIASSPSSSSYYAVLTRSWFAGLQVGTLIGVDGADGIVKMGDTLDIHILDLSFFGKLDGHITDL
jgi:hypothetical protein